MPLTRSSLLTALAMAGTGLLVAVFVGTGPDTPAPGTTDAAAAPDSAKGETSAPPTLTARLVPSSAETDEACAFEPLRKELATKQWHLDQAAAQMKLLCRTFPLDDANPEDPQARVTLLTGAAAVVALEERIAQLDAKHAEARVQAERLVDSSPEAFADTLPQELGDLGLHTDNLVKARAAIAELRAAGTAPDAAQLAALQEQIAKSRSQLLDWKLSGYRWSRDQTNASLAKVHTGGSLGTVADDYATAKSQYLAAKAEVAELQQRYQTALLIPLPATRTKDWRQPASLTPR